tara:strand:+ start:1886 stop:2419 length:534 start_codon:yes stop_codon:yes gene_type:complete
MKNTFKYLALSLLFTAFVACGDDDDSSPSTAASGTTTLIGLWKAFEFKGDDGAIYALNQFVPYYDTSAVPGCSVFDYREKYLELTYNFQTDSTGVSIYRSTDEERTYTVNNAATCDFSYGPWITDPYSDTENFTYKKLSNTELDITFGGSSSSVIITYSINGGILILDDYDDIKYRK